MSIRNVFICTVSNCTVCKCTGPLFLSLSVPFLSTWFFSLNLATLLHLLSPYSFFKYSRFLSYYFILFIIFWFPYPFLSLLPLSSPILLLQILKLFLTSRPCFLYFLYPTPSLLEKFFSFISNLSSPFWLFSSFSPNISLQCHSVIPLPISFQTSMSFFLPFF